MRKIFCGTCGTEAVKDKWTNICSYCGSNLTIFGIHVDGMQTKICDKCGTQNAADKKNALNAAEH